MNNILEKIKHNQIDFQTDKSEVEDFYYVLCETLIKKYGQLPADYGDKLCAKRGKEWLDIHHICELDALDDVARKTNLAIKAKDTAELKRLEPYNRKEQLVYANKVEHFALHYLIDIYRGKEVLSGGCWWILPTIFDMEYKTDFKQKYLAEIQKNKREFYSEEDFFYLFELAKILKNERNSERYNRFIQMPSVHVSDKARYFRMIS